MFQRSGVGCCQCGYVSTVGCNDTRRSIAMDQRSFGEQRCKNNATVSSETDWVDGAGDPRLLYEVNEKRRLGKGLPFSRSTALTNVFF